MAQRVTNHGSALRHAVHRAVNRSCINDLPQDIGREPDERADHGAKIKLVHVVLVVEQLVDAFRSAARNLLAVHLPRYNEPCESRSDGHAGEYVLQMGGFRATGFAHAKNRGEKLSEVILAAP